MEDFMSLDGNAPVSGDLNWELKQLFKDAMTEYGVAKQSVTTGHPATDSGSSGSLGIPVVPQTPKPVHGVDYLTAQDLINLMPSERQEFTDLAGDVLLAIHISEMELPDDKKLKFFRR